MTRYVMLHKLSRGFKDWRYSGSYDPNQRETFPEMNEDFIDWQRANHDLIKNTHKVRMVELDRTHIALEFHNEDDALLCMLTFG